MTASVRGASPNATTTWLSTTSLSTSWPAAAIPAAKRRASRQVLSTSSARPSRPRKASAAHTSTPLARWEDCGVRFIGSASELGRKIGGGGPHRRPQGAAVADQGDAAVVGRVQPLMGVGRPGVGLAHTGYLPGGGGRGRRPEPERAVHVDPRAVLAGPGDQRHERVAGAAVDVARLQAHQRRAAERREVTGIDPALAVDRPARSPGRGRGRPGRAPCGRLRAPRRRPPR